MSVLRLNLLKEQLNELGFDFIQGHIETFMHDTSRKDEPFLESLLSLFDMEIQQRRQRATDTRLKISNIPEIKELEEFNVEEVEGVTQKKLNELAEMNFVEGKENIIIQGPNGVGKSHLLVSLARKACREGYSVYYKNCMDMIEDLMVAKSQNKLKRKINTYRKHKILIIEKVCYSNMSVEQADLFFQVVAARYEKGSIMIETNRPFAAWGEKMGEVSIAAAIVDRLLHHAHVIVLKGDSYRLKKRLANGLLPQANEFGVY